jgi:beta-glucosidase
MTVARLVFPALRWRKETGFGHEDGAIDAALSLGVGGFIVFGVGGARADEIGRLTEEIRHRAGRPLLIGSDLERGAGQQARRLTEIPPPAALDSLDHETVIAWAGTTTAREARRVGINWVLAPDADLDLEPENPIIQTRSFGSDPERVSHAVSTWIRAAQAEGVLACAKHYPGHGRTRVDSHEGLPRVATPLETLTRTDLRPFAAAVDAGVASIMTAHVAYPDWDPAGASATRSPVVLGYLRRQLRFGGLIVTDALIMEGARAGRPETEVVVEALMAGCDLLLYPGDLATVIGAIRSAADSSETGARVQGSLARYQRALESGSGRTPSAADVTGLSAPQVADQLLARGFVRGLAPSLRGTIDLEVVDDDQGGWYAPGPSDLVRRTLARRKVAVGHGGARVVLAFAEPRAAKGRAGFGPVSQERLAALAPGAALVILFAHPRLAVELPGDCPVLCAWHRQPLMQEAVGRWLERAVGGNGER